MSAENHSADSVQTVEVVAPLRSRARSAAEKLIQAAALAAALVPLSTIKADATSLKDCSFSGGVVVDCSEGPHGGALYQWDSYSLELTFEDQRNFLTVEFGDFLFTHPEITERFTENFQGYEPLPICPGCLNEAGDLAEYVEFRVTSTPPQQGTNFVGDYDLYLYWKATTDADFPNPQILHDLSSTDDQFDTRITLADSYTNSPPSCVFNEGGCESSLLLLSFKPLGDPGVGGRDNMFTGFTLAAETVPEPASLLLLGSGVSAMLYRRRRAQKA